MASFITKDLWNPRKLICLTQSPEEKKSSSLLDCIPTKGIMGGKVFNKRVNLELLLAKLDRGHLIGKVLHFHLKG